MVTPIYPTVTGRSGQSADWARRLLFALGVLLIARLGRQVPIPGIDPAMLGPLFDGRISATGFDVVARTSLFALGLTPFVSAWVVVEIFRGSFSQRNVARNRRWLTAVFAALQAGAVANGYMAVRGVVLEPGQMFWLTTTLSLTAGTMLLLWLGEQITRRGLCDGVWLIVAAEFIAELPSRVAIASELVQTGSLDPSWLGFSALAAAGLIALIVVMETARRHVMLHPASGGTSDALLLKLDNVTILPAYIASIFLMVPVILVSASPVFGGIADVAKALGRGQPIYLIGYAMMIVLATFLATAAVVSPRAMASRLKSEGNRIDGVYAVETEAHLDHILMHLTGITALYFLVIFWLPELIASIFNAPIYLGGTPLLVVVIVMLDILSRVPATSSSQPAPDE